MKKSALTISILSAVGILGITFIGANWYTGNQVENAYRQYLPQINQNLKKLGDEYDIQAEIKNVQFDKGIFSSNVKYDVIISSLDGKFEKKILNGSDKLFHGPFPLNRLGLPVALTIENQITSTDADIQKIFSKPQIFSANLALSYDGNVSGNAQLNPVKWMPKDSAAIDISAINIEGDLTKFRVKTDSIKATEKMTNFFNLNQIEYQGGFRKDSNNAFIISLQDLISSQLKVKSLQITDPNNGLFKNKKNLSFDDLEYKGNITFNPNSKYAAIMLGESEINIKSIKVKADELDLSFDNIALKGSSNLKQDRIEHINELKLSPTVSSTLRTQKFGEIRLQLDSNLDAEKVNTLTTLVQNGVSGSQLSYTAEQLMADSPKIKVGLELDNSSGKNKIVLDLKSGKVDSNNIRYDVEEFVKLLDSSKLDIQLNKASIEELISQLIALGKNEIGMTKDEALDIIEQYIQTGKTLGLITLDNENVKLNAEISQGKVKLNEAVYPASQVPIIMEKIMLESLR